MIHPITMYGAKCDHCGEQYEDTGEGYSAFIDERTCKEYIMEDGWHTGDGNAGDVGKHYCAECFYFNDDDVFCLTPRPLTP